MGIQLLGPVEVQVDGTPVDIGHAKQRAVLAILAADVGRVVSVDRLVSLLWGRDAPGRTRTTLHTYLTRLRRALDGTDVGIERRTGGYRLAVAPEVIDLHRFDELIVRADSATGDTVAVDLWEQALALWRGEPFTGLNTVWLRQRAEALRTRRLTAELNRNAARIRLGRHLDLLPRLEDLAAEYTLDERVADQYMTVLYGSGRTGDALEVYRGLRARMVERLGHEPGPALQDLHRRILANDVASPSALPVPRQLPQAPRGFIGRERELSELNAGRSPLRLVTGQGGTGKSWLAVYWAHQVADRFPDGQLYVDFRGFDPVDEARDPSDALLQVLVALGMDTTAIPAGIEARSGMFRSLIADRKMLLVVENVSREDQLTPLLPGTPTCVTVVTGRHRLTPVMAKHAAQHVEVGRMDEQESAAVLARYLGGFRVAAEPAAVAELVEQCDRLPLALSIMACHAAAHPDFGLSELVSELRDEGARLDILDEGDLQSGVRAALAGSVRRLSKEAVDTFELCGVAAGSSWDRYALASLTGLPLRQIRTVLAELERAHLVEQYRPGRFRMHDLTRLYAADRSVDGRHRDALRRQVDYYLYCAAECRRLNGYAAAAGTLADGGFPVPITDARVAMTWLETEAGNIVAAQRVAVANGWDAGWRMVLLVGARWVMHGCLDRVVAMAEQSLVLVESASAAEQAHFYSILTQAHAVAGRPGLAARFEALAHSRAEASSDRDAVRRALQASGNLAARRGAYAVAVTHFEGALRLARHAGYVAEELGLLNALAWCYARQGQHADAMLYGDAAMRLVGDESIPIDPVTRLMHEGQILDSQGVIHHRSGSFDQAVELYLAALDRFERMRWDDACAGSVTEADSHERLGDVYRSLGDQEKARRSWEKAIELYRTHDRYGAAVKVGEKSVPGQISGAAY